MINKINHKNNMQQNSDVSTAVDLSSQNKFGTGSDRQPKTRNVFLLSIFFLSLVMSSCKKFIEVDPPFNRLVAGNVYANDATAADVLTGMYATLSSRSSLTDSYIPSISLYAGLSADELNLFALNDAALVDYYRNDLSILTGFTYWNDCYAMILRLNNAKEGLDASQTLNPAVKQQLLGEVLFLRSLFYFYLVNMYGEVPLITSSDWKVNALLPRSSASTVYEQIINDLKEAQTLLSDNYLAADVKATTNERVRPTKWAATALLARVYLYMGDWAGAELQATSVINNAGLGLYTISIPLTDVFKKNSRETIWALKPVGSDENANTGEGQLFILPTDGPDAGSYPVYLSKYIVNAFENNDQRKINWVDSVRPSSTAYYYPKKYRIGNVVTTTQEYPIILRLAEQYLIRAEARAQLNNISGAQADLNLLRTRAGLANTTAGDKASLLTAILHERQVELFTEWGHRWFDLKRTGNLNAVMAPVTLAKGNNTGWRSYQALYPIPQADRDKNFNLTQNENY